MRMTPRQVLAAAVTLVLFTACSSGETTPSESTAPRTEPTRLTVSLSAQVDTVPELTSKPLVARVTDQTGLLKADPVSWTTTNASVVSVTDGLVSGVAPGTAMVIASAGNAADSATIVVTQNDLSVEVEPSAAAVAMGDTLEFTATVRTRSGDVVSVNTYQWTSSDTATAEFLSSGTLHTKREGDLSVMAEALHRRGYSSVKVFRAPVASVSLSPSTANVYKGATLDLDATLRDQYGRVVTGTITWGSSDFSKATVSQSGLVTGMEVGSVVITATSGTKTGSATINVLSAPASAIQLSFPADTVMAGLEMQASATPVDASGQPVTGRTIAWQSANPGVATVTTAGVIKGIASGSSNVSAIVDGVIATRKVSVRSRAATSLMISPSSPTVTVGQQSQLDARVLDQNGIEITGQSFTWTTSNPAVALVSGTGMLSTQSAGSATITATSGALSASVTASVVNAPVVSVQVSPASITLTEGQTGSVSATAMDYFQNVLPGRVVSWSSQNTAVATVNASGVVTAKGAGTTNVIANIEGKTAAVSVDVNAPAPSAVASVAVNLANSALSAGQQTQATAVLRDAAGQVLTGRPITWFSLDTAVAQVSASGQVTARQGGTVAIMARSENVSGSASLTVTVSAPAAVATVMIEVPTQDIVVGQSVQSVVTLLDTQGNVLTGRTVSYSTENAAIITVSASGVVKGIGAGTTRMRATSGGITKTETFRVTAVATAPTMASITVSPSSKSLVVDETTQAQAVAQDTQGNVMGGTTFTWTTSNAAVATVSPSGLVTAVSAGSATIRAAASGFTGSLAVTVTAPAPTPGAPAPATLATVTVSLSQSSILIGGSAQATAVAKDAQGNVITGRTVTWSGGGLLAQVSSSGVVTALLAGIVPVTATIDGKTGSASLTITALLLPPPPPPPTTANVELPRTYLNFNYPAKTGQSIIVPAGGNLQTALNNAQRGDEIVLAAGATYSGNFTLPAKSGSSASGWITIRSDKLSQLPSIGTRVTSANATLMPKIVSPNTSPAIKTAAGTSGWWLAGLEVTVSSSVTTQQWGLIFLGESGSSQSTLASVPSDLVLDRMYIHGQTNTNLTRCISLNSARSQVSDSYVVECHGKGFDSQAIWGGNGPGPYKIVNNTLQGAGENIMFGGSDPTIPGLVPSDIEILRNYVYTPISWKGTWSKKNLLEFKNASRVLIEGNVFDGSWTDAQTGWAIILKSANQGGACRWCRTTDVTFRRNLIRNAGAGINVAPRGDNSATDTTARRILVSETVLENIGVAPYTGDVRGFQLLSETANVTIERTVLAGNLQAAVMMDGSPGTASPSFRDNVWARGQYGVIASGAGPGTQSLNVGAPGWSWANMALVGASQSGYPSGTSFVSSEGATSLASQIRALVAQAVAGVITP